jgi:cell wall-associated NlpC family hydrolase
MRKRRGFLTLLAILAGAIGAGNLHAQDDSGPAPTKFISEIDEPTGLHSHARPPDAKEILVLMGEQVHTTELDCSHFVQWLFERAGLYYDYAPSRMLYEGMAGFERVFEPEPGDLIVWPGHVGIVDPVEETFLSALRSGVKTSSYTSAYWKRRGQPHFLRYTHPSDESGEQPAIAGER